jgi:hypothetical protein
MPISTTVAVLRLQPPRHCPVTCVPYAGGFLFDRLEDAVRANNAKPPGTRAAIATVCLRERALPPKPPPRILVFTGAQSAGPVSAHLTRLNGCRLVWGGHLGLSPRGVIQVPGRASPWNDLNASKLASRPHHWLRTCLPTPNDQALALWVAPR